MLRAVKIPIVVLLIVGIAFAIRMPGGDNVLGSYATSLQGRTRGQHINALRAARALDGVIIPAGKEFSFNHTVGSWTPDRGYVLAPVSYDGELVVDWGGGVCQTSTTLYNAALIAGLQVVERHRHAWLPHYVPAGCDAAVAQFNTDLRLRNPYSTPVRLHALIDRERIGFEILGRLHGPIASVVSEVQSTDEPIEVTRVSTQLHVGQRRLITHGRPGVHAAVMRTFLRGPRAGQHELVSQDAYPAMNKIVALGEE